jgi:hypothetical protein
MKTTRKELIGQSMSNPILPAAGSTPEFTAWKQRQKLDKDILDVPPNNETGTIN